MAKLEHARARSTTCPRRFGAGRCGAHLLHEVGRDGRVTVRCLACERLYAGICADCPRPVEGRVGSARRCAACKEPARRRQIAASAERNRAAINARAKRECRRIKREDPERYAHRLATKKVWRERNRTRIKLQKRKWRLNPDRPNGYSSREKYEAYHRDYRERHRAEYAAAARERYRRLNGFPHPCCHCGCGSPVPWNGIGRPRRYVPEHHPALKRARRQLMNAIARSIQVLERQAERARKKLATVEHLRTEIAAIEAAVKSLRQALPEGAELTVGWRRKKAA